MKGEKFISMLNNHALVINRQARTLERLQAAISYHTTREKAVEQVLSGGRWSFFRVALREMRAPGAFVKAVDAAQRALLTPEPAAAAVKPTTGAGK